MVKQEEINTRFLEVIRYLKSEYGYTQDFIVEKAKLGKSSISKIRNGENNVGDKTITKICNAFKLNPAYIYGHSEHMTSEQAALANVENELSPVAHLQLSTPSDVAQDNPSPAPFIPTWADSLIDIMTSQIKQNEALNRELRQSISEVNTLRSDLEKLINKLK